MNTLHSFVGFSALVASVMFMLMFDSRICVIAPFIAILWTFYGLVARGEHTQRSYNSYTHQNYTYAALHPQQPYENSYASSTKPYSTANVCSAHDQQSSVFVQPTQHYSNPQTSTSDQGFFDSPNNVLQPSPRATTSSRPPSYGPPDSTVSSTGVRQAYPGVRRTSPDASSRHKRRSLSLEERDKSRRALIYITTIRIPTHVDAGSTAEILVCMNNKTDVLLEDVNLDLSDMEEFFIVEGGMRVASLRPGMELETTIKIKPRFSKGSFPVSLSIAGNGVRLSRKETIKVGGTEVY